MVTKGSPENTSNDHEPGKEVERASPDPEELLKRAEKRAETETREAIREMRKAAMRGSAFQLGKEATKPESTDGMVSGRRVK